jgi:hypothetical protein
MPCSNFLVCWHRANQGDEGGKMRENLIEERGRRQNNFLQGFYHKARSILLERYYDWFCTILPYTIMSLLTCTWFTLNQTTPFGEFWFDWNGIAQAAKVSSTHEVEQHVFMYCLWYIYICDRTTLEMRDLSPKIILGDSRWSKNA